MGTTAETIDSPPGTARARGEIPRMRGYRHGGRILRGLLPFLLGLLLSPPAMADERFPRIHLMQGSVGEIPPPVAELIAQVDALSKAGYFAAGQDGEPLETLGGLAPKAWLLSRVSEDFDCRRDFGGMCTAGPPLAHLKNFVARFGDGNGPWQKLIDARTASDFPLAAFGFDFELISGHSGLSSREDGLECVPARAATDRSAEAAVDAFLGDNDDLLLDGLNLFRVVRGRYRVRQRPSLQAPVVNRLANELVFVPAPGDRFTTFEDDRRLHWAYVVPAEGDAGFAAFAPGDLLPASDTSGARVCFRVEDGVASFAAHIGGGD